MGSCRYQFNPSELYQRTKPGQGVETTCGARTFPANDEPELVIVVTGVDPSSGEKYYDAIRTGRFRPREQDDPYCPAHGGSPEPPPPPVSMAELEAAHAVYAQLATRYAIQEGGALPNPVPAPASLAAPPVAGPAPGPGGLADLDAVAAYYARRDALRREMSGEVTG